MLEVWWRTQTWPLLEQTPPKPSRPEMLAAPSRERGAGAARVEEGAPGLGSRGSGPASQRKRHLTTRVNRCSPARPGLGTEVGGGRGPTLCRVQGPRGGPGLARTELGEPGHSPPGLGAMGHAGGLGVVLAAFKQQEVTEGFKQDKGDLFSIVKRCSWCRKLVSSAGIYNPPAGLPGPRGTLLPTLLETRKCAGPALQGTGQAGGGGGGTSRVAAALRLLGDSRPLHVP